MDRLVREKESVCVWFGMHYACVCDANMFTCVRH